MRLFGDDSNQIHLASLSSRHASSSPIGRYFDEPARDEESGLWLYGNTRLFRGQLACIERTFGNPDLNERFLQEIECQAEEIVLAGKVLVCGIHNAAHMRSAVVSLRWGSPRIVVMSGGFKHHLGERLEDEPFRAARLWRYKWDRHCDLAVSRRAPDKKPTYASLNPTVDRLIAELASGEWESLLAKVHPLAPSGMRGQ